MVKTVGECVSSNVMRGDIDGIMDDSTDIMDGYDDGGSSTNAEFTTGLDDLDDAGGRFITTVWLSECASSSLELEDLSRLALADFERDDFLADLLL